MMQAFPKFLSIGLLSLLFASLSTSSSDAADTVTDRIAIDQFGYLPGMKKIAVISDPQQGFNATESYTPGQTLEVKRSSDQRAVYSGPVMAWKNGVEHDQSGDKIWWFDFTSVNCPDEYYIYDPTNDRRSYTFKIGRDVYNDVLKQAVRVFFYQRCAYAKQTPFADPRWVDAASHLQDIVAPFIGSPGDVSMARDVSGGWYDAGDYNKYVNFTTAPLSNLLFAYQNNPNIWGDDYGLPESGNSIPDILDEIKWELDWLLKMRNNDGSVLNKVSVTQFQSASPPSSDLSPRFYGAASTSSTLSAAISFAHAAIIFNDVIPNYALTLRNSALSAWEWAEANPNVKFTNQGFSSANPEVDSYTLAMYKLSAAVYLYALTTEAKYRDYVEANYPNVHALQWTYWYGFEPMVQDALLYFTSLPGVNSNVVNAILTSKHNSMNGGEFLSAYNNATDAYRAYLKTGDYTWGSNNTKSSVGLIFLNQAIYGIDAANASIYRAAGAGYLHYLHGINPLGMVYLTQMYEWGAERCANEIYHGWFADGTDYDNALNSPKGPAPGYVPGGPNGSYQPDSAYRGPPISPPQNQPVQKAYKDWNTNWPENSWTITEPAIYYQAAYVNLLATVMNQYLKTGDRTITLGCLGRINRPNPPRGLPMP